MKRFVSLAVLLSMLALPAIAVAQGRLDLEAWIDTDDDGLPGPTTGNISSFPGYTDFDVWVDAKTGFMGNWTNYIIWLEGFDDVVWARDSDTSLVRVTYIGDYGTGTIFPVDDFSHPFGLGFGGFGISTSGINKALELSVKNLQATGPARGSACITPIVDYTNPYAVYCVMNNPMGYGNFDTTTGACWTVEGGNAVENTSWGQVKALFR